MQVNVSATCDDVMDLYADGAQIVANDGDLGWGQTKSIVLAQMQKVLALGCKDLAAPGAMLLSLSNGFHTDSSWRCSTTLHPGWNQV